MMDVMDVMDVNGAKKKESEILQLRSDGVRHGPHRKLQGLFDVRCPQAVAALPRVIISSTVLA